MKTILLPAFLLVTFFSNNAFARHAYRSESCTSTTHDLYYKGNYPVGGMYGMTLKGQEEETTALPLFDASETANTLEDANVIFNEVSSKITEQAPTSNDCWFEHDEWKSEKIVEILSISDESSKKLNLKAGDKMTFICEESTDYPTGNDCL